MTAPLPPALVLTAGLGTRLAPLTGVRAKPAVPVSGMPLILRLLRWLAGQGVPAAVLNLHYRPDTITRCVGHGTASGLVVRYSWETTILGTAGGPRRALPLLGERFFLINGDTLTDVDLRALLRAHEAGAAQVTLAVAPNPAPARYGGVTLDDRGRVRGFSRPGRHTDQHFLGVQIVESAVFAGLRDGEPAASIGGVYNTLITGSPGAVGTYASAATFHDIGTPADYLAAALALARAEGLAAPAAGERCAIDGAARLVRTAVWDDVVIGAGCRLTDCIVADGVRIPPGSTFDRQIITAAGGTPPAGARRAGDLWLSPLASAPQPPAGR